MNIEKINSTIKLRELISSLVSLETYSEFDDWVDKNLRHFWRLIEGDVVDFYYLLHSSDVSALNHYSIPSGTMHISLSREDELSMEQYFPGIGWSVIDKYTSHSPWVFFSQISDVLSMCANPDMKARIFTTEELDAEYYSNFGDILVKYFIGEL